MKPRSTNHSERLKHRVDAPRDWQSLMRGDVVALPFGAAAATSDIEAAHEDPRARLIFPGAFNPRHEGHRRMAALAASRCRLPVEHEISIENVDKPTLDYPAWTERIEQFTAHERLWLTRLPTFAEKAGWFAPATFVVGIDTLLRIADAKYYGGAQQMHAAFRELHDRDCRFLVFSRRHRGRIESLSSITLPGPLAALSVEVPAAEFLCNVSSSQIRTTDGR